MLGGSKTAEGLSPTCSPAPVTGLVNVAWAHVSPRLEERAALCPGMRTGRSRPGEWPSETSCEEAPGLQCPLLWQRDLTNRGLAGSSSWSPRLSLGGVPMNPGWWKGLWSESCGSCFTDKPHMCTAASSSLRVLRATRPDPWEAAGPSVLVLSPPPRFLRSGRPGLSALTAGIISSVSTTEGEAVSGAEHRPGLPTGLVGS